MGVCLSTPRKLPCSSTGGLKESEKTKTSQTAGKTDIPELKHQETQKTKTSQTAGKTDIPEVKHQETQKPKTEAKTPHTETCTKQEVKIFADNKEAEKHAYRTAQELKEEKERFRHEILQEILQEVKKSVDNTEAEKVRTAQQLKEEKERFHHEIHKLEEDRFWKWEGCEKEHILICVEHWFKAQSDEKKYVLKEWLINSLYLKLDAKDRETETQDIRVFSCAKGCCQERVYKTNQARSSHSEVTPTRTGDGVMVRDAKRFL